MKIKENKKRIFSLSMATLLISLAFSANAQDFYVTKTNPVINDNLYNNCGKICPEIDYYFVDSGQAWLDAIINKDVTTGIAINTDSKDTVEEKKWQAFTKNPLPSNSQYTERLNSAISRLIAENKEEVAARGKDFDTTNALVQVSAKPEYLGHKDNLEIIATDFYQYTGGAHGLNTKVYYVFDMTNKKQVLLNDILLPSQKPKLEALAKAEFVKFLKANDIDPNKHFEGWPFALTDNYSFNRDGITLLYQPYEIGYYALGAPELTVSYSQLNGIVKPQYLK